MTGYCTRKSLKLLVCLFLFLSFFAGDWKDFLLSVPEKAEKAYQKQQYEKALELYQEAQTRNPESDTLAYNLGNTLYKLGKYQEASGQYGKIIGKQTPALSTRSLYNMGNTLYQSGKATGDQQMFEQSLEAYKQAMKLDPQDEDTKYNYELVKRLLKKQQQQQQKDQNREQDQKKNQSNQNQQQDRNKQQQQQQQQPQQQQPKPGQMSKEEAERILNALMQSEKEMQKKEKNQKAAAAAGRQGRDW